MTNRIAVVPDDEDPAEFLKRLKARVDENGGVIAVQMEELRDGFGWRRLGPHVAERISDKLAGVGLGHAPDPLPEVRWERTLLFTLGSDIGRVIGAVLDPDENGAALLREKIGGEAAEMLAQIRALVSP
jgi:hypothetical protein